MKKIWAVVFVASLLLSGVSAWANSCPTLIKEGREKLAAAKLSKANESKAKGLLDEAQRLHESGSHGDSVKKANEALSLLK
jgi:hypothetical protein